MLCGVTATVALVGFWGLQLFGFNGFNLYHELWKVMLITIGVGFLILLCFFSVRSKNRENKVMLFSLAPLFCYTLVHFIIPIEVKDSKCPGEFIQKHMQHLNNDTVIISDKQTVGAICWYLKRDDIYIYGSPGELSYGFDCEDQKHRELDSKSLKELIKRNKGKTFLICRAESLSRKRWKGKIPEPDFKDQSNPDGFILWRY